MLTKGYWIGPLTRKDAQDREVHLRVSINSIINEKGEITGFFAIYTNLTEINKAQEEIKNWRLL